MEIPLCSYDSCRLLAINLLGYVENAFTEYAYFDFEKFKKHVMIAQRIMDDIVDLELEKIKVIISNIKSSKEDDSIKLTEINLWETVYKKTKNGRRTGLGITAEGDMLAALGLIYGTSKATDFAVSVQQTLAQESYRSSFIMAKERGSFPVYDAKKEINSVFINRLLESDPTLRGMAVYGRRNIANLTIAPTGSTSLMTQTTSGIEPVFLPVYKRRKKVNVKDANSKVDFIDANGDAFEEYIVFHHQFKNWMKINGYDTEKQYTQEELDELVSLSPYYKATSADVDWVEKVRMQGEMQKWVDHSISVTVNLPAETTVETVSKVYMTAWESGCKGLTVYRDGSRGGVLVSASEPKKEDSKVEAFNYKRPKSLDADILRFNNNKEKWVAFVGVRDGKPYEIFTGLIDNEALTIPAKVKNGKIIKRKVNGVGVYDFEYDLNGEKQTVSELSKQFNAEYWNYAKLISGNLRHNMPVDLVVKLVQSLSFDNENINSWRTGVVRALKQYVKDGTKANGVTCPDCGSDSVIYQEGCLLCTNCGSSKCG